MFCSIITWNFFCFMHYRETVFFLFYTYFRRSKYKYIRKFITVDWLDTKITFSNKSLYEKKKKSEAFNIYHCEGLAGVGEIFCQQFLPKQENSSRYLMLCFLSCGIYPFLLFIIKIWFFYFYLNLLMLYLMLPLDKNSCSQ